MNEYVMLMGIDDVLALAKTPERREELKESLIRLMEMKDEDIDFSDIRDCTMNCVRGKYTGGLHNERRKTGKTQNQQ